MLSNELLKDLKNDLLSGKSHVEMIISSMNDTVTLTVINKATNWNVELYSGKCSMPYQKLNELIGFKVAEELIHIWEM